MGNGTKVALVALLIVMVVVVATFVNTANEGTKNSGGPTIATPVGSGGTSNAGEANAARAHSRKAADKNARRIATRAEIDRRRRLPPSPMVSSNGPTNRPGATSGRGARNSRPGSGNRKTTLARETSAKNSNFSPIRPPGGASRTEPLVRTQTPGTPRVGGIRVAGLEPPESEAEKRRSQDAKRQRASAEKARLDGFKQSRKTQNGRLITSNVPNKKPYGTAAPRTGTFRPSTSKGNSGKKASSQKTSLSSKARTHVIVKNDSYWALANKYYGNGQLYPVIEAANKGLKFHPGKSVNVPELSESQKRAETKRLTGKSTASNSKSKKSTTGKAGIRKAVQTGRTSSSGRYTLYTVKRGDTIDGLAKRFLGSTTKSRLIYKANRDLEYTVLQTGSKIRIPRA